MSSPESQIAPQHIIITSTKSVGIQILLVFFLGPLGLFYSTIKGALIMLFGVPIVFGILFTVTGLGAAHASSDGGAAAGLLALGGEFLLLLAILWIGSFVWGVLAVKNYNEGLLKRA